MKLYYNPGACSLATHITLAESGLKYTTESVDLSAQKTKSGQDFGAINPKNYVPVLELDNGEVLTEGAMLLQYIADKVPDKKLIPKQGTMERYRCMEWLNYVATELHKGFSPLWNDKLPQEVKNIAMGELDTKFDFLEKHFSNNEFLMGSQYSVADVYLFTILNWSNYLKMDMSKWKKLLGFVERVKGRTGTQMAFKAEGLNK